MHNADSVQPEIILYIYTLCTQHTMAADTVLCLDFQNGVKHQLILTMYN